MLTTSPHLYVRRPSPTTAEFTVSTCPPMTLPLRLLLAAVLLARLVLASGVLLLLYAKWAASPFGAAASTGITTHNGVDSPSPEPPSYSSGHHPVVSTLHPHQHGQQPSVSSSFSTVFILSALETLHASPAGRLASRVADPFPPWAVLAGCAALLWLALRPVHTTESLLVLRGLGVQTSSSGTTCLSGLSLGSAFSGLLGLGGGGGSAAWWPGAGKGTQAHARFIPTEKIRDVLINEAFRGFEVRYYLVVVVEGEDDVVVVFPRLLPRRAIVEAVWRGVRGCLYEPDMMPRGGGDEKVG